CGGGGVGEGAAGAAIPPALDDAVLRALAKRRDDRFPDAAAFAAALRATVASPRADMATVKVGAVPMPRRGAAGKRAAFAAPSPAPAPAPEPATAPLARAEAPELPEPPAPQPRRSRRAIVLLIAGVVAPAAAP